MGKVSSLFYFTERKVEKLLLEFEKGDKKNYYWVLDWIKRFQIYVDNPKIIYDKELVLNGLESVGYRVNAFCEDEYDENNEYIEAAYLIGQFMCCIKYDLYATKSILHLINRFENKYGKIV